MAPRAQRVHGGFPIAGQATKRAEFERIGRKTCDELLATFASPEGGLYSALARRLPRGYATLQDQLRRALLSAYLGIADAPSRRGADRLCRFRCARRLLLLAAAESRHLLRRLGTRGRIRWGNLEEFLEVGQGG